MELYFKDGSGATLSFTVDYREVPAAIHYYCDLLGWLLIRRRPL